MLESLFDSLGKLIVIFIMIILFFWLIFRLFGKYILKAIFKRASRRMNEQFQEFRQSTSQPEGQTTIAHNPQKKTRHYEDKDGDYIDYEEID